MREVCFILAGEKILRVYFGTESRIPDERERWDVIWEHRFEITEIVHSHPDEFLDFSHEDLTTIEAVEAGTGKRFVWSIVTESGFLSREERKTSRRDDAPWWLELLRRLSYQETVPARKTIKKTTIRKEKKR